MKKIKINVYRCTGILLSGLLAVTTANSVVMTNDFSVDFSTSESLWGSGGSLGLDKSGRTTGSVGAYYSVKANTGTVNANVNGVLRATYDDRLSEGLAAVIDLGYLGDVNGSSVESRFGASAEAGVFLDISGCLGVTTPLGCAGVPYDIDVDIPVVSEGFFIQPTKHFTSLLDSAVTASDNDDITEVGAFNLPVLGSVGPEIQLELAQEITFTPDSLDGLLVYNNLDTGERYNSVFSVDTLFGTSLTTNLLSAGTWEFTLFDINLDNSFNNDIDLRLKPVFDYIVGEYSPGFLGFGLLDETFALDFNTITMAGSFRIDVASVPEPSSLALMSLGLLGFGFANRKKH